MVLIIRIKLCLVASYANRGLLVLRHGRARYRAGARWRSLALAGEKRVRDQVNRQKLLASAAGKSRSEKTMDELHAEQQACEGGCAPLNVTPLSTELAGTRPNTGLYMSAHHYNGERRRAPLCQRSSLTLALKQVRI